MQLVRFLPIAWMFCAAVIATPVIGQEVELPERAAAPQPNPQAQAAPGQPAEEATDRAQSPEETPAAAQDLPASSEVPVPEPRPGGQPGKEETTEPPPAGRPGPEALETPPPESRPEAVGTLVPPEEMACRARLTALGVDFEVRPAQGDASGCSMPFPLSVSSLSDDIALEPAALVNCATAEAAARFVQDVVAADARRRFGSELKAVRQVSGYVCRPRNGTRTLSEHAFGNALDFGAFVLADGRVVEVRSATDPKIAGFLAYVRSEACGPFKTVLGPGTDADHADHFHFDLAERSNGSTYCR